LLITTRRSGQLSQKRACPQGTRAKPARGVKRHFAAFWLRVRHVSCLAMLLSPRASPMELMLTPMSLSSSASRRRRRRCCSRSPQQAAVTACWRRPDRVTDSPQVSPGFIQKHPDNCLHHLLPPPRDLAVTSRLSLLYIQDQVLEQRDTAQHCMHF